jgi:hypothetical protein
MSSIKHKGADSIVYNATRGTLVTSGVLLDGKPYKIKKRASTGSALPSLVSDSVFWTPQEPANAITLAVGDEVWPMTFSEICKVDMEISGEMGVIETTDSCDYPYTTNIPDGYTSLSGSIGTMLRFDSSTDALVDVTKDFLVKFFDITEDDGEGTYTITAKDDSDLLLATLLNRDAVGVVGKTENWFIVPIILNSISMNVALKDVYKGDYSWTKGQGPAQVYLRSITAS